MMKNCKKLLLPLIPLIPFNVMAAGHGHSHSHDHDHGTALDKLPIEDYDISFNAYLEVNYLTEKDDMDKFVSHATNGINLGHNEFSIQAQGEKTRLVTTLSLEETTVTHSHGSHSQTETLMEEAFFEVLPVSSLLNTSFKLGRFKSAFGQYNSQHLHDSYFTEQPVIYRHMFGGHTYFDDGVSLSLPIDQINTTVTYEYLKGHKVTGRGQYDKASAGIQTFTARTAFEQENHSIGLSLGAMLNKHGANIWDWETQQEWYYMTGEKTYLAGIDVTFNNLTSDSRNEKLHFEAELFHVTDITDSRFESTTQDVNHNGYHAAAVYQFNSSWKLGLRHSRAKQHLEYNAEESKLAMIDAKETDLMLSWKPYSNLEIIAEQTKAHSVYGTAKFGQKLKKLTARYHF